MLLTPWSNSLDMLPTVLSASPPVYAQRTLPPPTSTAGPIVCPPLRRNSRRSRFVCRRCKTGIGELILRQRQRASGKRWPRHARVRAVRHVGRAQAAGVDPVRRAVVDVFIRVAAEEQAGRVLGQPAPCRWVEPADAVEFVGGDGVGERAGVAVGEWRRGREGVRQLRAEAVVDDVLDAGGRVITRVVLHNVADAALIVRERPEDRTGGRRAALGVE